MTNEENTVFETCHIDYFSFKDLFSTSLFLPRIQLITHSNSISKFTKEDLVDYKHQYIEHMHKVSQFYKVNSR